MRRLYTGYSISDSSVTMIIMDDDGIKWLLKGKLVRDFKGFPLGTVKKIWFEEESGPLVIVERENERNDTSSWEAIPLTEVDSVTEYIRLKPPTFAE
ncbi:MAG: PRC-barrel domain-containing protein [Candidatus Thorarchaeota archaeon]